MFRRKSSSLPKDPVFPADLEGLGYFITEKDQIRSIANPEEEFNYFISKNERVCEVQREAMSCLSTFLSPFSPLSNLAVSPRTPAAIRSILHSRFLTQLNITRLPLLASPTDPHVPIYTSPNLSTASRLIVYFGEEMQDLGVFALRTISQSTITSGSALAFVSAIQSSSTAEKPVGVIIANMGQLLWYRRGKRAVTRATWAGLPRKTGVSQQLIIDPEQNRIPGNEDLAAHTKYIFEHVIARMVNPVAKLDIIGLGEGAEEVVDYLQYSWETWKERIQAIVVGSGYQWPSSDIRNPEFADFWGKRARAYLLSTEPLETPLSGREGFGCNCYSSGEEFFTERIMVEAHASILRYFSLVDKVPGYQELPIIIPEGGVEQEGIEGGWGDTTSWGEKAKNSADVVTDADADAAGALAINGARSVAAGAATAAAAAVAGEKSGEKKTTEAERS